MNARVRTVNVKHLRAWWVGGPQDGEECHGDRAVTELLLTQLWDEVSLQSPETAVGESGC